MLGKPIREMNIREKADRTLEILSADEIMAGQAARMSVLCEKLKEDRITVSVIGQFKRGKSALINRIIGSEILPVGIVPITSAITVLTYGPPSAEIRFRNGRVMEISAGDLHEYVSEQENRDNEKGVRDVVIRTPSPFLQSGLTLVDTPGVGSFHKNNTETACDSIHESDAVIFLLSVDSPINQIEIDFLRNAEDLAGRFYFAVNKTDLITENERSQYVAYCEDVLRALTGQDSVRIFPVSARTGAGVEELKQAVTEDLASGTRQIMERSAEKKLRAIVKESLVQLDFYWKAMNMPVKELDECFDAMGETLREIREDAASCSGGYQIRLNEYKLRLSDRVRETFGMEYHYEIDPLKSGVLTIDRERFLAETEQICGQLSEDLNRILLYREENAYKVCHRINAINRTIRELRRVRDSLQEPAL